MKFPVEIISPAVIEIGIVVGYGETTDTSALLCSLLSMEEDRS